MCQRVNIGQEGLPVLSLQGKGKPVDIGQVNNPLRVLSLRGSPVEIGKVLADLHFPVHSIDREKIVGLQLLDHLFILQRGKRRTDVGVVEMAFQVRQDGLQMREHRPIRVGKGEGEDRFHSFFCPLLTKKYWTISSSGCGTFIKANMAASSPRWWVLWFGGWTTICQSGRVNVSPFGLV